MGTQLDDDPHGYYALFVLVVNVIFYFAASVAAVCIGYLIWKALQQ